MLDQAIRSCNICSFQKGHASLPVPGKGNESAFLAIVGQNPGKEEGERGEPFIGEAGRFLNHLLEKIGVERKDIYATNVLKCVGSSTLLYLPDGSRKRISDIVKSCYDGDVLSLDGDRVVPRRVVGWYRSPLAGRRVFKVSHKYARRGTVNGRSCPRQGVARALLTGDHEILTKHGWKEVDEIRNGELIATGTPAPSTILQEVVSGMMLGDSTINKSRNSFHTTHGHKQREYATWKTKLLSSCFDVETRELSVTACAGSSKRYDVVRASVQQHSAGTMKGNRGAGRYPYLRMLRKKWYPDGKKVVPKDIVLTDLMLAVWYMDDGHTTLVKGVAELATNGFSEEDRELLVLLLRERGLLCQSRRGRIHFDKPSSVALRQIVSQFVPSCMSYKLWRDAPPAGGDNLEVGDPKQFYSPAVIEETTLKEKTVYCIDVEGTHNFITTGNIIAHNCLTHNNATPSIPQVKLCASKWLDRELETINPHIIVCLGWAATHYITGSWDSMEQLHGRPISQDGRIVLPAYHPAAGFHNTALLRHIYDDFKVLGRLLQGASVDSLLVKDEYPNPSYHVVETEKQARELLAEKEYALDTELGEGNKLWSIQVSMQPGEAYFIPEEIVNVMSTPPRSLTPSSAAGAASVVARSLPLVPTSSYQLTLPHTSKVVVHSWLHEAKYLSIPNYVDTMLVAYLLGRAQGLKELANRLCGMKMKSYTEMVRPYRRDKAVRYLEEAASREWSNPPVVLVEEWSKKLEKPVIREKKAQHIKHKIAYRLKKVLEDKNFDPYADWFSHVSREERAEVESVLGVMPNAYLSDIPFDEAVAYANRDPDATMRVYLKMMPEIKEQNLDYILKQVDLPVLPMVRYMMDRGTVVNVEYLKQLSLEYFEKMVIANEECARIAGHPFNPKSDQQVGEVIYKELGFKPTSYTQTGRIQVNAQELGKVQVEDGDNGDENGEDEELKMVKHPIVEQILAYRHAQKLKSTYADALVELAVVDEQGEFRVHTNLKVTRTETGRLCVARGTMIDIARDLSEDWDGIPIESVREGDLAYCFDSNGNLALRKVLWAGRTGTKRVTRVHWMAWGGKKRGHIDLTPEHKVRLVDGSYRRVRDLESGSNVLSLARSMTLGYARLHATGHKEMREQRFIWREVHGEPMPPHIHHRDGTRLNNRPHNLEGLSASEHPRRHPWGPEQSAKLSATLKKKYANGEMRITWLSGSECHNWLGLNRRWLIRKLHQYKGKPALLAKSEGIDYETLQKYLRMNKVEWQDVAHLYTKDERKITRELIERAREVYEWDGQRPAQKSCCMNYYKFKKWQEHFGFVPYNHVITKIEELPELVDVYDIEVEGEHNFIANQICVHNSASEPNLQNQPVRSDDGKKIRRAFTAPKGGILIAPDWSQQEMMMVAHLSGCKNLIGAYLRGEDVHMNTQMMVFKNPDKRYRRPAKNINFGVIYGISGHGLYEYMLKDEATEFTEEDCEHFLTEFYKANPEVRDWQDSTIAFARRKGYVVDMFGRRRFIPEVHCPIKKVKASGERMSINMPVQGGCATITKLGMIWTWKNLDVWEGAVQPSLQVHDELLLELLVPDLLMDVARWLKDGLENVVDLSMPLKVDVKAGERWGDMEELEL